MAGAFGVAAGIALARGLADVPPFSGPVRFGLLGVSAGLAGPARAPAARRIPSKRATDLTDRALRDITVSLGGPANGYPRQDGFDIVVASEVMAIFCLATSLADLKERLGNIVVGYTRQQKPVTARDLKAHGAMTVLLKDALAPNLVQTLENNPAILHGGPFANIAHGCNSVIATQASACSVSRSSWSSSTT